MSEDDVKELAWLIEEEQELSLEIDELRGKAMERAGFRLSDHLIGSEYTIYLEGLKRRRRLRRKLCEILFELCEVNMEGEAA